MPHDGKYKWSTVIGASEPVGGGPGGWRILEVLSKLFWKGSWVAWNFRRFYSIFMTKFLKFYSTSPTPVCIYGMFIDSKYPILQANEFTIIFFQSLPGQKMVLRWSVGINAQFLSGRQNLDSISRLHLVLHGLHNTKERKMLWSLQKTRG